MIDLYLTKDITEEDLEDLTSSTYSRNLANYLVKTLSDINIGILFKKSYYYLVVDDGDLYFDKIPMILSIGVSNSMYLKDDILSEDLMNQVLTSIGNGELNIFNRIGDVSRNSTNIKGIQLDNLFMNLDESLIIEDVFPTDENYYYSFYLLDEFEEMVLYRDNSKGIITNFNMKNLDTIKKDIILNQLLKKFKKSE